MPLYLCDYFVFAPYFQPKKIVTNLFVYTYRIGRRFVVPAKKGEFTGICKIRAFALEISVLDWYFSRFAKLTTPLRVRKSRT